MRRRLDLAASLITRPPDLIRDTPVPTPTGAGFSVTLSDANQAADVLIALRDHDLDIF